MRFQFLDRFTVIVNHSLEALFELLFILMKGGGSIDQRLRVRLSWVKLWQIDIEQMF